MKSQQLFNLVERVNGWNEDPYPDLLEIGGNIWDNGGPKRQEYGEDHGLCEENGHKALLDLLSVQTGKKGSKEKNRRRMPSNIGVRAGNSLWVYYWKLTS